MLLKRSPSLKKNYKISIIIPAYNEEKNIGKCIESILENDYKNKQVIVVDDGSTDNTYAIASRYRDKALVLRRSRSGLKAHALNYGLRFTDGDIIVTLDADTLLSRDALRKIAEAINKFKDEGMSILLITHYQRLLDYISPDRVHVYINGQIAATDGPELARKIEENGYAFLLEGIER